MLLCGCHQWWKVRALSDPIRCAPRRNMVTVVVWLVCSEVAQGGSAHSDAMLCRWHNHLMRVPTGGRKTCATMLHSDLERILNFGKKWLLKFEAMKTKAITISRKRDPHESPPLVMDGTAIVKIETLEAEVPPYKHSVWRWFVDA